MRRGHAGVSVPGAYRVFSHITPPVEEIKENDLSGLSQEEKPADAGKMRQLHSWELTWRRSRRGESTESEDLPVIELPTEQRKQLRSNARTVFGTIMDQRA